MKTVKRIGLIVLASACAAGLAQAVEVTNYDAIVADAFIRGGEHAGENYGFAATMILRNNITNLSFARKIYIKVDVKSILGAGGVFADAALNLVFHETTSGTDDTFLIYGIMDQTDTWEEETITWSDAPENDKTSGDGVLDGASLLGTVSSESTAANNVLSFSSAKLTEYLNRTAGKISDSHSTGDSAHPYAMFIITSSSIADVHSFFTKDSGNTHSHPYLSYTITSKP